MHILKTKGEMLPVLLSTNRPCDWFKLLLFSTSMRTFLVFSKLLDSEGIPTEMHTSVYCKYLD